MSAYNGSRFAAVAVALLLSATALGGCTSDSPEAEASATIPAAEQLESGQIDAVPAMKDGWSGVLKDVTVDDCPLEAGEVTAKGTVVNSGKNTHDIAIVVSWNAPGSTDPQLQLSWVGKQVGSGDTVDWSVTGELLNEAGQCVISARSGTLTGK